MEAFNWSEFLREGAKRASSSRTIRKASRKAAPGTLIGATRWALTTIGLALACSALRTGDSWVKASPIFTVLGGAGSFAFLAVSLIAGVGLWLLTRNGGLCAWAAHWMPFAAQPYRSAAGVFLFFLIAALSWDQLPGVRRIGLPALVWLNRLLWAAAVVAWVVVGATLVARCVSEG